MFTRLAPLLFLAAPVLVAVAALPPAPDPATMLPVPTPFTPDFPGLFARPNTGPADVPITIQNAHFYAGKDRIKFLGLNFAFSANFPTHDQADAVAHRLSNLGINAVRCHHMDMQQFPGGIFADDKLETLSDQALDRFDYLVAALKKQGIYIDLNLHVSRHWTRSHHLPNADKTPDYDKIIDLFDSTLISAQKTYAKDLLTHVNKYTGHSYASEPAVALVEINNENSFFCWNALRTLDTLPEPYASEIQNRFNHWLVQKYQTRAALLAAWSQGAKPLGDNLLKDPALATLEQPGSPWYVEQHAPAAMTVSVLEKDHAKSIQFKVTQITPTDWHLQFQQRPVTIQKDHFYTLTFRAHADQPRALSLGVGQDHEPWEHLGLLQNLTLTTSDQTFRYGFTALDSDTNARLSFSLGQAVGTITLADISLAEGGQVPLQPSEDPTQNTVSVHDSALLATLARHNDWYDFLQQTEQAFFVDMYHYIKTDLGARAPITGTVGYGALGTQVQTQLDYIDNHEYHDHPSFPSGTWSNINWQITNKPMVDSPTHSALHALAADRVAGKPFTVTEYNHAAPNEYQAECLPMLAAVAALQDWDAIFPFAYSHISPYERNGMTSFFDYEGNPAKLNLLPLVARIFRSSAISPLPDSKRLLLSHADALAGADRYQALLGQQLFDAHVLTPAELLTAQWQLTFADPATTAPRVTLFQGQRGYLAVTNQPGFVANSQPASPPPATWTASGPGTGQFAATGPAAAVYAGFPAGKPIDLGPVTLTTTAPFAVLMLASADPNQPLDKADRLLLIAIGRIDNTGMQWNAAHNSVSHQWGPGPALLETIPLTMASKRSLTLTPLTPAGQPGAALPTLAAPHPDAIWYELTSK